MSHHRFLFGKRNFLVKTFVMGFAGFLLSSPSAAEETKRTRIYVSVLGGSLAGVKFLNVFDYVSTSTGWEFSANVSDESGIQKASAMTYGFSIGYLRGLGDPGEKHYAFSYYVELSAFPKTKLPDGIETETVWDYGATINTYAQTGRRPLVRPYGRNRLDAVRQNPRWIRCRVRNMAIHPRIHFSGMQNPRWRGENIFGKQIHHCLLLRERPNRKQPYLFSG